MTNIWGFLLQTTEISAVCLILLIVKLFFKDKLPPFWQYSIWSVAAVALLYPVGLNGFHIFKPVAPYILAAKTTLESRLISAYTVAENIVCNKTVFPYISASPSSITDMLFIIYTVGVVFCVLRYMKSYIQLGNIIKKSTDEEHTQIFVNTVARKYNLKPCKVKTVPGLTGGFVYGIFSPVLVLPADKTSDEKVILHELLHLKYFDLQQKVVWSFFRALHWPNPFMHYIFNYVNNDIESLCDNRVLQLLEGEERRDYGRVLLSMTNEKYPSAFGTSSISNGSGFIAQRIETIARFKLYPQGMGLVCGCILALLLSLTLPVVETVDLSKTIAGVNRFNPSQLHIEKMKLINCKTVGGAAHVFMVGNVQNNTDFLPAVQPEGIALKEYEYPDNYISKEPDSPYLPFHLLNLIKIDKNNYKADFMIRTKHVDENTGRILEWTNYYICPVSFAKQHGGWKVSQTGDSIYYYNDDTGYLSRIPQDKEYTGGLQKEIETPYGTIKLQVDNIQKLNQYVENDFSWFMGTVESGSYYLLTLPDVNRGFNQVQTVVQAQFFPGEAVKKHYKYTTALAILDDAKDNFSFDIEMIKGNNSAGGNFQGAKYNINSFYADMLTGDDSYFNRVTATEVRSESTTTLPAKQPVVIIYELWLDNEKAYSFKYDVKAGVMIE